MVVSVTGKKELTFLSNMAARFRLSCFLINKVKEKVASSVSALRTSALKSMNDNMVTMVIFRTLLIRVVCTFLSEQLREGVCLCACAVLFLSFVLLVKFQASFFQINNPTARC